MFRDLRKSVERFAFSAVIAVVAFAFLSGICPAQAPQRKTSSVSKRSSPSLDTLRRTKEVEGETLVLGRQYWERPLLPDLRRSGQSVAVPPERTIDIVILGDGFLPTEHKKFNDEATLWYKRFLQITPYNELRGVFRVRALWTPSPTRCSKERNTFYHIGASGSVGMWDSKETREAVFGALSRVGVNPIQRGALLDHAVVAMLIRNTKGEEPSGIARTLVAPGGGRSVRMAMGEHVIHEFTHAFAGVSDEYIDKQGSVSRSKTPLEPSIFTLSNIVHSRDPARIPWMHYAPGSVDNPDPNSVIGLLWVGGVTDRGSWHSQPHCLMNGPGHDNWSLDHSHFGGKNMRDYHRFCFWCEEIITAKTYQKAGVLGDDKDGTSLWKNWITDFRPGYLAFFNVPSRLQARNAEYTREHLADAKIYERPVVPDASTRQAEAATSNKDTEPDGDEPDERDTDKRVSPAELPNAALKGTPATWKARPRTKKKGATTPL